MLVVDVLSDLQIPYQDNQSLRAIEQFWSCCPPDVAVYNGDIWDFEMLTMKYAKKPESKGRLVGDLEIGLKMLERHRSVPRRIFIAGNHEARWDNYIEQVAEELYGLPALDFPSLLKVYEPSLEIVWPYGEWWEHNGFIIYHGQYSTKYAAEAEYRRMHSSGMSGHTHRAQVFYDTDHTGRTHAWYINPCLCHIVGRGRNSPPPRSTVGPSTGWQQGFARIYFNDGGPRLWNVYQVSITQHRFIGPDGRLYQP